MSLLGAWRNKVGARVLRRVSVVAASGRRLPRCARALWTPAILGFLATAAVVPLLLPAPPPVAAQGIDPNLRFAVVIGNAAYPANELANPHNDARAVTGALREVGFKVKRIEDATRADFRLLVEGLPKSLPKGAVVIFYFAGHAIQYQGKNYLLPVDFKLDKAEDLPGTSLELSDALGALQEAQVGMAIVVLDACRDYPFGPLADAFGDGLANVATSGETLVAYATAAGQVAQDGTGPNSPYTSALITALELPGRDIYDVFRTVRAKVREATEGQQIPWVTGSIESDLVLRKSKVPAIASAPAPDGEPALIQAAYDPADVHWNAIAASADPGDFERFAAAYPQNRLAALAREREQQLLQAGAEPIPALSVDTEVLPTPAGRSLVITPCDRWAADPEDPQRLTEGVPLGLVNTRQAIRDCAAAVEAQPDEPRLNFMLGRALDIAERFAEAEVYYQRAADTGYAAALFGLGRMYRTGRGVTADAERGAQLYLDAAIGGSPSAREAVAFLYEHGWGVPQSNKEMLRWLELTVADGHAPALDYMGNQFRVGKTVPQDYNRAFQLYTIAAGMDNANAISNLARLYRDGTGAPKDVAKAVELYRRAAELGNPFAPYQLSLLYMSGADGVERNPEEARRLLELSADRGYEWAFWQLSKWYEGDKERPADLAQALYYSLIAVEAGKLLRHPSGDQLAAEARERADKLRAKLSPEEVAAAETRAQTWLAQNSLFKFALIYPY